MSATPLMLPGQKRQGCCRGSERPCTAMEPPYACPDAQRPTRFGTKDIQAQFQ